MDSHTKRDLSTQTAALSNAQLRLLVIFNNFIQNVAQTTQNRTDGPDMEASAWAA
jgi:hypothetical protein